MMSKPIGGRSVSGYAFPVVILAVSIFGMAPSARAGLGAGISKGSLSVPDSRVFDWTAAGVTGGIPDTSGWNVINTDLSDTPSGAWGGACSHFTSTDKSGASDMGARIQCFIKYAAAHPTNGGAVVLLGAGTFMMTDNQILMLSNVVLRGAGSSQTIFSASKAFSNWCGVNAVGQTLQGAWAFVCFTSATGGATSLSADINPGDMVVQFSSDPGYTAGQLFYAVEKTGDPSLLSSGALGQGWGYITGVFRVSPSNPGTGTTRNLDRPAYQRIRRAYNASSTPFVNPVNNAGLENIGTTVADIPGCESHSACGWAPEAFEIFGAYNVWVHGIEAQHSGGKHGEILTSRGVTIDASYFHNLQFTDHGLAGTCTISDCSNDTSSIYVGNGCESVLVMNNRFSAVESTVEFQVSATRNVYAYNYSFNLNNQGKDPFFHGNYEQQNLSEGNSGFDTMSRVDMWWSTNQSPVFYRNRYLGDNAPANNGNPGYVGITHEIAIGNGPNGPTSEVNLLNTWYNVIGLPGCDASLTSTNYCSTFDHSPTVNEWAEKNRYLHYFRKGAPVGSTTYVAESTYSGASGMIGPMEENASGTNVATGYSGLTPPSAWIGLSFPPSLFLASKPSWWCNETPWPTTGADIDLVTMSGTGNLTASVTDAQKTPAQRMKEGLACTTSSSVSSSSLGPPGTPVLVP